jgi:hypothetical protein
VIRITQNDEGARHEPGAFVAPHEPIYGFRCVVSFFMAPAFIESPFIAAPFRIPFL